MKSFSLVTNSAELRLLENIEIKANEFVSNEDYIDLEGRPLMDFPILLYLCLEVNRITYPDGTYSMRFVMAYYSRSRTYAKRLFYFGKKAGEVDFIPVNNWCSLVRSHTAVTKVISDLYKEIMQNYSKKTMDVIEGMINTDAKQLINVYDRWGKIAIFKIYKRIFTYSLDSVVTIPHLIYMDPKVAAEYVHYKKNKKSPKKENTQLDIHKYMIPIFDMQLPKDKNKK